jgi:large subunit ribosomal protein L21
VLRLNRITEVGSREYIIKPSSSATASSSNTTIPKSLLPSSLSRTADHPTLPPSIVSCTLTVLEHTKSPLQKKLLKKRRKGYKKTIQHKQGWTRLRVGDVVLGDGKAVAAAEA